MRRTGALVLTPGEAAALMAAAHVVIEHSQTQGTPKEVLDAIPDLITARAKLLQAYNPEITLADIRDERGRRIQGEQP